VKSALAAIACVVSLAAAAAQQRPAVELTRKGYEAMKQGRTDEARLLWTDALRLEPALTEASLALGELIYRGADLDNAIAIYERALTYAPDHPHLTRRLAAWRKEAELHNRFGQRLGDHFTVLFEGPAEAQLAERAVQVLEGAFWRIGGALNAYPVETVTVVLYTREQFRDITQSPDWAGGAYDGRIRMPVQGALANPREFERVLAHEFTHALVRSLAARGVPFWLDEGLAVVYEGSDLSAKREQVRRAAALLPLTRLERSFANLTAAEARLAYAQSAVAVQALIDHTGPAGVVNLLNDIGRGQPFADAFERHALLSYADFQAKLAARDDHEIR
jgi:tetratricopeptide (TPR) repeat protein